MEREKRPRKVFQWNQKQWFNQKCWLWELGFSTVFEIKKKKKSFSYSNKHGKWQCRNVLPTSLFVEGELEKVGCVFGNFHNTCFDSTSLILKCV